jgi:small-conductance mechanosensitive channel
MTNSIDKTGQLTQQWLAEIKALKQQMAKLQSERDEAWQSSQKWRELYNTEAEQRRNDAELYKNSLTQPPATPIPVDVGQVSDAATIEAEIAKYTTVEELRGKLIAVIKERDRLLHSLKIEQANHAQTRKSLTTALGDAIDSLTRERAEAGKVTVDQEDAERGEELEEYTDEEKI